MGQLHIFCHLSVADALAVRCAIAGDLDVPLSDGHLDELATYRLADLATPYIGLVDGDRDIRLPVKGAGWIHVLEALRETKAGQAQATRGIELLLASRGTPDQLCRWKAAVLPEDELLVLARSVAFMTFEGMPKYVRIERDRGDGSLVTSRIIHLKALCTKPAPLIEVCEQRVMDQHQFAALGRLQAAAARTEVTWAELGLEQYFTWIKVTPRRHTGTCPDCGSKLVQMSGLVEVQWAGRTLSREYAL